MKSVRIATNKETGKRYFVKQICFQSNRVYCWGEVCKIKNHYGTTHEKNKVFLKDHVEITEVDKTSTLVSDLFEQFLQGKEEQGFVIKRNRCVSRVIGKRNDDGTVHYY